METAVELKHKQEPVADNLQSETDLRGLFYYLINIDEFPVAGSLAKQLVEQYLQAAHDLLAINSESADSGLPDYLHAFDYSEQAFEQRLTDLQNVQQQQLVAVCPETLQPEQLIHLLKQYAPVSLLDGCWLQNISLASNCHDETAAGLFHLYAQKIGDGDTTKHYGNLYRQLLQSAGIRLPEVNNRLFTTNKDILDSAFGRPVFQLALSLLPRTYLPELIGYTLGHFVASQDYLLMALTGQLRTAGFDVCYLDTILKEKPPVLSARDEASVKGSAGDLKALPSTELIVALVKQYLSGLKDDEIQAHWRRIWTGLVLHHVSNQDWQADLKKALTDYTQTPRQKMLALVRAKAVPARNMHRKRKLQKRLLDDWFAQEPFDAEGFLDALAASPYVNRKVPEKSPLTTRSIEFGGPMFRIFTDAEQAVIREWIVSLAREEAASDVSVPSADSGIYKNGVNHNQSPARPGHRIALPASVLGGIEGQPPVAEATEAAAYAKCGPRELYYYFVNADLYPDVLPTAYRVARQFMRKAAKSLNKKNSDELLNWFPYRYEVFENRVQQIYESETNAYEPLVGESTVPREIMVWYIQQYAAFTMVDGSWVQNIARAGMSHTEISARLFRIYSDEVGNADTYMNHPNVYRRMLEDEGIHMPPTESLDFAMQPALLDFAFDLPLLTLSVSMFPKTLLPEIIGVNLAIELSGLGKGYMQVIDELRYWKIDPYFFTLHLTIDNIASGHTAVAIETVHLYLDQVMTTQGQAAMQQEWRRIWTGYLAFTQTAKQFESNVELKAAIRFIKPLLQRKWKAWRNEMGRS
ncbi:MAG: iron-containing redox enzyme family protein [Thiolinea sp.]